MYLRWYITWFESNECKRDKAIKVFMGMRKIVWNDWYIIYIVLWTFRFLEYDYATVFLHGLNVFVIYFCLKYIPLLLFYIYLQFSHNFLFFVFDIIYNFIILHLLFIFFVIICQILNFAYWKCKIHVCTLVVLPFFFAREYFSRFLRSASPPSLLESDRYFTCVVQRVLRQATSGAMPHRRVSTSYTSAFHQIVIVIAGHDFVVLKNKRFL